MVHPIRQGGAEAGYAASAAAADRPGAARPGGAARPARPAAARLPAGGSPRQAGGFQAPTARPGVRLTGRGAVLVMFAAFFLGTLISAVLDWTWLAGAAFAAGSCAAARYTHRRDLLAVAVSPPLLFLCALVLTRTMTAGGHLLMTVAEGCLLTLAGVAPWLFAGVAASLLIALLRGLPSCVRDLRRDLRAAPAAQPGGAAQSRRATPQ